MSSRRFSAAMLAAINESSRVIFGNLPVVDYRTGNKLLRRKPMAPLLKDHYLPNLAPNMRKVAPDYLSDVEESRLELLERLKRKGKVTPKKGQGKRATRKG
jgi:hypothetical protein